MIDIVKLILGCKYAVGARVSIEFNNATECNQMVRITFKWCIGNEYHDLSRIYTHQMIENCRFDLSECIIDDFKRHTTGEAK